MDTIHEEAVAAAGTRPDGTIDLNAAARSLLEGLLNAVMDEQASECFRQDRSFMGGTQNFQAWHCKFSCSARHAA